MHRKVVSVLFCDVVGSTALGETVDPEALQALLARYFERMKAIVESHGGSVEKFIGDAVMAVFGVPAVHEDDALRACRAAVEMREAFPELGVQGRIGVNTGEVVRARRSGSRQVMRSTSPPGYSRRPPGRDPDRRGNAQLVHDAVETEPVEPLQLKGKSQPVPAHRWCRCSRHRNAATIGLRRPRRRARAHPGGWERAQSEQGCELVTSSATRGSGNRGSSRRQ